MNNKDKIKIQKIINNREKNKMSLIQFNKVYKQFAGEYIKRYKFYNRRQR